MVSSSTTSSRSVPVPVPVATVTVYVGAGPAPGVTDVIDDPLSPVVVRAKSVASTPDTGLVKVTVNWTDAAAVGFGPTRVTADTVGGAITFRVTGVSAPVW